MAKRRHNNEATYFVRKDRSGKIIAHGAHLRLGGKRYTRQAKTKKELERKLKALRSVHEKGLTSGEMNGQQFFEFWLSQIEPSVRPSTFDKRAIYTRVHFIPAFGQMKLREIQPLHIQQFLNLMLKKVSKNTKRVYSPQTVADLRNMLIGAFNKAVKWKFIAENPAMETDKPEAEPRDIQPLTEAQAKQFEAAIRGHRLYALYMTAMMLGLRKSELMGLRWQDVDLENRLLTVRYQLQRLKGKAALVEPKTQKSRRKLRLPHLLVSLLKAHQALQAHERQLAGGDWQEFGLVFTTQRGTPHQRDNVNRHLTSVLKQAGLPPIRFHDLRHTAATLLLAKGLHLTDVQETLGHSSYRHTQIYTHWQDQQRDAVADRLDAIWQPPNEDEQHA